MACVLLWLCQILSDCYQSLLSSMISVQFKGYSLFLKYFVIMINEQNINLVSVIFNELFRKKISRTRIISWKYGFNKSKCDHWNKGIAISLLLN